MPNIGDTMTFLCIILLLHRIDVRDFLPMVRNGVGDGYMLPWSTK